MSGAGGLKRLGEEALYLGLHHAFRMLPTEACSDAGARLSGILGRRSHPVSEARSRVLLARLRPDWANTPAALEAAVARTWENAGRVYAEYSVLHRLIREGRVTEAEPGRLAELTAPGQGPAIFAFLHLGNWEVVAHRLAHLTQGRGMGVGAPPASAVRGAIFRRWHDSLPGITRPTSLAVWREVIEMLRRPDGAVLLNIDEPNAASVSAPFFGRTPRLDGNLGKAVRLAAAARARIVIAYAERVPGARFVIHALPVVAVDPRAAGVGPETEAEVLRIDSLMTPVIRRFADQWHMAAYFGKDVEAVAVQAGPFAP